MLKTARKIFFFFFFLGQRAKKMKAFLVLSLLPVALAIVVRILLNSRAADELNVFSEILLIYDLQFLIIILALFYGTSVCSEELEGQTLPYLTSRPLSKPGIILGKFAAYTVLMAMMIFINLILSFFILNYSRLNEGAAYAEIVRSVGVLFLGLMAYTAFFTFLGTVIKKSILIGLLFGFGWENVIPYFPGSTQRFSIIHYLKSLLPYSSPDSGKFSLLMFRLEPTPPAGAVLILLAITTVFLAIACLVFRAKEYLFEE